MNNIKYRKPFLSRETVDSIRDDYLKLPNTISLTKKYKILADKNSVNPATISKIVKYETYTYLKKQKTKGYSTDLIGLTKEDKILIQDLYDNGISLNTLSKSFDISKGAIHYLCHTKYDE